MAFLHSGYDKEPIVCVLHQDARENRHVRSYRISTSNKDLKDGPIKQQHVELGASFLVPVPAPLRGVLVVGEQTITYLSEGKPPLSINFPFTIMQSWTLIDEKAAVGSCVRFLLGDRYGVLYVLFVFYSGAGQVTEMRLEEMGKVGWRERNKKRETLVVLFRLTVFFCRSCRHPAHLA